ncbi:hypothetical protein DRQ25_15805 [Candidatus Fermentibacteria bacterium]|nr:MAG: hypothetical protein DRQ25_15805 [Candidatus Fermentibacteria bacterium]
MESPVYMRHFVLAAALIACGSAAAGIIEVPGDCGTIQEALDSALSGDTILVAPGTYVENIIWPDVADLFLVSEQGPSQTIIDGDSTGTVITLLSPVVDTSTVISGFTIRNGAADQGGGIRCSVSSPLITGNIIEECFALSAGGGLYCAGSRVVIDGNTIRYNSAGIPYQQGAKDHTNGGGIYLTGGTGIAVISDNIITQNFSVDYGGGITCNRNTLITGNQIIDNQSGWFGGGIYHLNASGTILHENLISGNTSLWGAGITLQGGHLTITKCEILYNVGDGLHIYYGTLNADSSTFANNTRDGIGCGSLKAADSRGASVHHCNITDNDGFGIRSSNEWFSFDATMNWWGDPGGPGGVGPGSGDEVSRFIEYDPWLIGTGITGGTAGDTPQSMPSIFTVNPVRSAATLIIEGSGPAELFVLDLTGRIVSILFTGNLTGMQPVNWDTSDLASGIYFICIVQGEELSTRSVTVIR